MQLYKQAVDTTAAAYPVFLALSALTSILNVQVGGGAQGAKNPGGVEGTEEDSSQPSTGKEAGGQDSRLGPGSDASSGDGADQAADGGGDTSSEGGDSDGGDGGEEDEEEGPAHDIQVNTVPFDPRFPGVNQVPAASPSSVYFTQPPLQRASRTAASFMPVPARSCTVH